MFINNFLQNQIYGQFKAGGTVNNLKFSGYLGTIYSPVGKATEARIFVPEEERPPRLIDFVSGQEQIDQLIKQQFKNLIYDFSLGQSSGKAGNVDGFIVNAKTPSAANTEFEVAHKYRKIPKFFFIIQQDKQGTIFKSGTKFNEDTIFLKSDATDMTFFLLLFGEDTDA